jgi:hypothetical protein
MFMKQMLGEFVEFLHSRSSPKSFIGIMLMFMARTKKTMNAHVSYSMPSSAPEALGKLWCHLFIRTSLMHPYRLISIFLVVFGMSVLDGSAIFTKISQDLFSDATLKPAERNARLKVHIEELLEKQSIPLDAKLVDVDQYSNGCKL